MRPVVKHSLMRTSSAVSVGRRGPSGRGASQADAALVQGQGCGDVVVYVQKDWLWCPERWCWEMFCCWRQRRGRRSDIQPESGCGVPEGWCWGLFCCMGDAG
jgi:hypothetical protein